MFFFGIPKNKHETKGTTQAIVGVPLPSEFPKNSSKHHLPSATITKVCFLFISTDYLVLSY